MLTTGRSLQPYLPAGAAASPVILATDKTQLTQFSGNKSAYPVYLTLGNIPGAIRRRPSEHACILLGYLPVSKVSRVGLTKCEHKARTQRIFHAAMRLIVSPLIKAGKEGIEVTSGDGCVRKVFPVLASYVADYPEQCLVTCSKYGTCPKCQCPADKLGDDKPAEPRTEERTEEIIQHAWQKGGGSSSAVEAECMMLDTSGGVKKPFWTGLPFADIPLSITPDVLHQLYQGVFKHLVSWCQDLLTPEELDNRLRCLPLAHGVRHFKNGISSLSQISGKERKEMACVLLACLVGKVSKETMLAFRSLLDFIYLAQYLTHDEETLGYLEKALQTFHTNKNMLVELGIRDDFNIPKLHSLLHYAESIQLFGTTDNYNTEMFERLHIDFAKDAWRATNHRDEFPQMVRWITRNEKMALYEAFQKERALDEELNGEDGEAEANDLAPSSHNSAPVPDDIVDPTMSITIARYPPAPQQHLTAIQNRHRAPGFTTALAQYLNSLQPEELRLTRRELSQTWLPFSRLDVYHKYKFKPVSLHDGKEEVNVIKAIPSSGHAGRRDRFDTAIVLETGEAESTGVQGEAMNYNVLIVCRD